MRIYSCGSLAALALGAAFFTACESTESDGNDLVGVGPDAGAEAAYSARLSWQAPTATATGAPLTVSPTFRIYLAVRSRFDEEGPRTYDALVDVDSSACKSGGTICAATVSELGTGTYYFAVTAVAGGLESEFSNEESKTFADDSQTPALADPLQRELDQAELYLVESLGVSTTDALKSERVAGTPPNPPTGLHVE